MNSRKLAGASAASVGAATAVAALLLGTLSGSAGEEPTASAFGIAIDGLVSIPPTPYVEAPPDEHKALLEVPGPQKGKGDQGIYVALLKVEAEHFRSKATAVDVRILGLKLKVLEATCENGHGDSSIISTDGGDKSATPSGQSLDLSPVIKVEFNRQHRDHDKLTVDAAVISLLPSGNRNKAVSVKDLNLLQSLASKQLKVPTMDQLQAAHDTKPGATPKSAPTVADLVTQVTSLNPGLAAKRDADAVLEIVISSASCREEHHENRHEQKEEAPPPQPVEAHLPVTH